MYLEELPSGLPHQDQQCCCPILRCTYQLHEMALACLQRARQALQALLGGPAPEVEATQAGSHESPQPQQPENPASKAAAAAAAAPVQEGTGRLPELLHPEEAAASKVVEVSALLAYYAYGGV